MPTLDDVVALARQVGNLAAVSTLRADGTIQSSLVNAGVLAHPVTGGPAFAFVTYGPVKLANLRHRPQLTALVQAGSRWMTVEGTAELFGPGDLDPEGLRLLLRAAFTAAGGSHDDWDAYDRVMLEQRRTAVVVTPTRVYSNA